MWLPETVFFFFLLSEKISTFFLNHYDTFSNYKIKKKTRIVAKTTVAYVAQLVKIRVASRTNTA